MHRMGYGGWDTGDGVRGMRCREGDAGDETQGTGCRGWDAGNENYEIQRMR